MPKRWPKVRCPKCNAQFNQLVFDGECSGGVFNMWVYRGGPYWTYDPEDDIPTEESFEEPPESRTNDGTCEYSCPHCDEVLARDEKTAIAVLTTSNNEPEDVFLRTEDVKAAIPKWLIDENLERVKKLFPNLSAAEIEATARNSANWKRTSKSLEEGGKYVVRIFKCGPFNEGLKLFVRTDKKGRLETRIFT